MLKNLLSTPTTQLGKAGRFAVFQIKLWSHCARLLKKNRAGQQAAALSYHTIFGIVPLAIVILLIFQSLTAYKTAGDKLKTLIYEQLNLATIQYTVTGDDGTEQTIMLTEHLDKIVGGFFTGTLKGSVTILSTIIVIWAALALLSTIEKAFNNIWHVSKGRNFVQRIINYWAVLTLGPLLLAGGIYIATKYGAFGQLQKTIPSYIGPTVLSYVITTVSFFLLYFILPNTRVRPKAAIWGAAVAALVWLAAKNLFSYAVIEWKPYGTVYGIMAIIPLTVVWIWITWLIVLFGLQLTFTTQHLKTLDAAEIAAAKKSEDYFIANDITAISIAREVAAAFERNNAPVQTEVISTKLNIPPEFAEKLLQYLVAHGILLKASEPRVGFIPAQDPENIKLSDIARAVDSACFTQLAVQENPSLDQINRTRRDTLAAYNLKQIIRNQ